MDRCLGKDFDGHDRTALRRDVWVCLATVAATTLFGFWLSVDCYRGFSETFRQSAMVDMA